MRLFKYLQYLLIVFIVIPISLAAQNGNFYYNTLDSITVISRNLTVHDSSSPYILTKLYGDNLSSIENRTLPEALMGASGVFIQKTNHGGGSAFIRGLTGNQTLILLDGIRLNNSTFRYGPNQYLNTIDLFSIEKVEVAKGIGAVDYGSDALAGVINLQTKKLFFKQSPTWNGTNLSRFISNGMEKTNRTEWGFSNKSVAWNAGLSFKDYGDLKGGGNLGSQTPSGYNETDYNTSLKIKLNSNASLVISSQQSSQHDIPFYHKIKLENYKINQVDLQLHALNYIRYIAYSNNAWRKEFIITLSQQKSIEQRSNQKNNSATLRIEEDTINTIAFSTELISKPTRFWTINSGIDFYKDKVNSLYKDINPLANSIAYKRGLYPNNAIYNNGSIFNLHHLNIAKWDIQTGLRYNIVQIKFDETNLGPINVKTTSLVADLALSYRLTKKHLFYANIANSYRAPNIDDLGSLGIVDFRYEIPANNLKPEKSINSEMGYKYASSNLQINFSAYYMHLKDLIARVKVNGSVIDGYNVYNKINIESAYIKGFEIALIQKIGKHLEWNSNTNYTYGQNLTKNEPMRRIPPMFGQNSLIWKSGSLSIKLNHEYAGAQTRLAQGDKDDNRIGKSGTPQWNVFNLTTAYEIKNIQLELGLLNILNEKYKTHGSGIYGMGRAISGSMLISF